MTIALEIIELVNDLQLQGQGETYVIDIPFDLYCEMCEEENVPGIIEINGVQVNVI